MKIVKIIFGVVAALFTVGYAVQFIGVLAAGDSTTRGTTQIAAALAALCMGAAITFWLFQSALKRH